jgi:hypothetical protein
MGGKVMLNRMSGTSRWWLLVSHLGKKINEMMTALRHLHDTSEDFGPG